MSKNSGQNGRSISLVAVGDIYIKRDDPASIMAKVKPYIRKVDIALANQESSISDRGTRMTMRLGMRSKPGTEAVLPDTGFHAVGLSNNHTMDFGPEGLLQTVENLDRVGIAHAGAGRNFEEAHQPALITKKGVTVALLSYTSVFQPLYAAKPDSPGIAVVQVTAAYEPDVRAVDMPGVPPRVLTYPNQNDVQALVQDIKKAKAQADIVVISWHWGISAGFRTYVNYQFELGHAAIDAGADLIFGHHAHYPLGIEVYKGKAIFYDMSNFAMELGKTHTTVAVSMMLRCEISGKKIKKVSFLPVAIDPSGAPDILDTQRGAHVVQLIQQLSERFGTRFSVKPDEVVVQTSPAVKGSQS